MSELIETTHSFREWRRLHRIVESLEPEGEPSLVFVQRSERSAEAPSAVAALPAAFNPPTTAHVELLDAAQKKIRTSEFLLILDKKTIDKELYGATLEDRLLMLELMAQSRKNTSVAFSSHGLFVEKADALEKVFPRGLELHFIIGYDTLVRLFDARYYINRDESLENLFSKSRFLVGNRGRDDGASVEELLSAPRNERFKKFVEPISISDRAAALSSTEMREKVERGEGIRGLVPPEVENFIRETGLYTSPEKKRSEGVAVPSKNRYHIRRDVMQHLISKGIPEGKDLHAGEMVNEVMKGEDIGPVVTKFLKKPLK